MQRKKKLLPHRLKHLLLPQPLLLLKRLPLPQLLKLQLPLLLLKPLLHLLLRPLPSNQSLIAIKPASGLAFLLPKFGKRHRAGDS